MEGVLKRTRSKSSVKPITSWDYINLLMLHLAIAAGIFLYRPSAQLYVLTVFGYFTFVILQNKNRNNEALMAAAYIAGAEVFFRMTESIPFYETGKYSVIVFLFIGMLFKGTSSRTIPFWTYLLILIPGIVVAATSWGYEYNFRTQLAFNLSGPVCLGVSALYCYYKKVKRADFQRILMMLLLPLLSQMFYLFLYTPNMQEVVIDIQANYAATAGYGPNQISTVFGLGAFLLVCRFFTIKNIWINFIDLILLSMMSYRALITFSRGGVIVGVVCIIAFVAVYFYHENDRERYQIRLKTFFVLASAVLIWLFSVVQSGGLLDNRYSNQDAAGRSKGDITTGRADLMEVELEGFYLNPVVGVGVGRGKVLRVEEVGYEIASHSEVSRLLSEHGMLGVIAVLILIFVPVVFWLKFKNNYYFLGFMAFWFLTVNHSAMRIALPALVYGLALLYIVDEKKNSVHR